MALRPSHHAPQPLDFEPRPNVFARSGIVAHVFLEDLGNFRAALWYRFLNWAHFQLFAALPRRLLEFAQRYGLKFHFAQLLSPLMETKNQAENTKRNATNKLTANRGDYFAPIALKSQALEKVQ